MAEPEQVEMELGESTTEPVVEETATVDEPVEEVVESESDPSATTQSELQTEREHRIRLEERLSAKNAAAEVQPAPKDVKRFTRSELRAAVNEGKLDDDQMEEFWANQQREIHNEDTEKIVRAHSKQESEANLVVTETQRYVENHPDILKEGSPTWNRVKKEYDFFRQLGDGDNKTTELKALRAALGSSKRIKEHTSTLRETVNETSSTTSGGGTGRHGDIFDKVPAKFRPYYKGLYERGAIDLETIKKDLPYMEKLS